MFPINLNHEGKLVNEVGHRVHKIWTFTSRWKINWGARSHYVRLVGPSKSNGYHGILCTVIKYAFRVLAWLCLLFIEDSRDAFTHMFYNSFITDTGLIVCFAQCHRITEDVDSVVQDCSNFIANVLESLLSYAMPSTLSRGAWAPYQIHKIAGCACAGNAGNVFPATDFKGNR